MCRASKDHLSFSFKDPYINQYLNMNFPIKVCFIIITFFYLSSTQRSHLSCQEKKCTLQQQKEWLVWAEMSPNWSKGREYTVLKMLTLIICVVNEVSFLTIPITSFLEVLSNGLSRTVHSNWRQNLQISMVFYTHVTPSFCRVEGMATAIALCHSKLLSGSSHTHQQVVLIPQSVPLSNSTLDFKQSFLPSCMT